MGLATQLLLKTPSPKPQYWTKHCLNIGVSSNIGVENSIIALKVPLNIGLFVPILPQYWTSTPILDLQVQHCSEAICNKQPAVPQHCKTQYAICNLQLPVSRNPQYSNTGPQNSNPAINQYWTTRPCHQSGPVTKHEFREKHRQFN